MAPLDRGEMPSERFWTCGWNPLYWLAQATMAPRFELQHPPVRRGQDWLLGLLLGVVTILAYQPVWQAGFIWDDDVYVTGNKLLTAPDGLRRIWLSQDSPSQYFPLVYTTFRLEHAVWGVRPAGYHWVNLLLHAANALLVWRLLRRLAVPGAWLAAALFALHPVQVESVAWVTERKNVLSLFFVLLALLAWVEFIKDDPKRSWRFYGLALAAYALALFSKTTACTLPAALFLILWLKQKRIGRDRLTQLLPFVAVGLGMGLVTVWWERHHIGTAGPDFAIGPLKRILIASHAVWFYAGKLFWPAGLTFSYPRWVVNPRDPLAYAWLAAGGVLGVAVYFSRRFFGRSVEVAVLFFVATLSPMLGFIMLYTFRYSFVADHYQYVACIGLLTLVAAGITTTTLNSLGKRRSLLEPVICAILVLALGALTWHQARAYRDPETLWRDTVAKNPDSWLAQSNLGRYLMRQGRFQEAMDHYRQALRTAPDDVDSLVSVGNALFGEGREDEAADCYRRALKSNPNNPEAHVNLAVILAHRGQVEEAMEHDRKALENNPNHITAHVNLAVALATRGRYEEAIEHYRQALAVNPSQPLTHINLAIALTALGRTAEARDHYHRAAVAVNNHAATLAQQGRLAEAAAQYAEAVRLIPDNAEAHCGLGALLARQGKTAQARDQFAAALRLKPDYAEAQQHLRALPPVEPGGGQIK
jgi:tetratricopeptide (TPR) repeat protein